MQNQYAGRCGRCGGTVPANTGTVEKRDGRWIVYHTECPEISSGLGIGGAGQHDLVAETAGLIASGQLRVVEYQRCGPMPHGQLWEPCPICDEEPVCLDCGYCRRHCRC